MSKPPTIKCRQCGNNNEVIINIISDSMDDAIMCARFFDPRYCCAQVVKE